TPTYGLRDGQPGAVSADQPAGVIPNAGADVAADAERAFSDPHGLMGGHPDATAAATGAAPAARRVGVLTGCVQESLFARVDRAVGRGLDVNGCDVVAVPAQVCCGALDGHGGRLERARSLARANIAAFEQAGVDTVVVNAAGCGAMMKEYGEQLRHDPEWSE